MKNLSLEIMVGVIHQCYSLEELAITSLYGWQETHPPQEPLHMPFLRYICVKGVVAPRLIRERSLWNNISTLDLWCAKFKDGRVLHDILKQCSRLAKLFSPVPQMPIGFTVDRTLSCPHLTYLELDNTHGTWLFSSLVAPALTELDFTFTRNFDLYPLRDMLVISKCPLRSLSIGYEGEDTTSSICPVGLHAVLAAAPSITELNCFPNIYVEEDILQDIGTGLLMPQLANFTCWPDSLKAFVKMIETRVERESRQQHITFCDIFGYILPDNHDAEVLAAVEARLGVVRRTYGIRCGFWEN